MNIHTASELQAQLDASLQQLETVTQHIREAVTVNNDLRREIGQLQRQLAQLPSGRAA
jgi:regulator of replication initiation timing